MRPTALTPPTSVARPFIPRTVKRLLGERSLLLGAAVLVAVAFMALAAPVLAPHDPNAMKPSVRLADPIFLSGGGTTYLLGTDFLGRDVLSRIIYGARVSLVVGLCTVLGAGIIGVTVGAVAGYYGKWTDEVLMRLVDIGLALPGLLLALAIIGILGPGLMNLVIGVTLVWWAGYARLVRGLVLEVRERAFIEAAVAIGASRVRIVVRHVVPNVISPIIVLASLEIGSLILAIAGLNFLGLGVQPPTAEWGAMLNQGRLFFQSEPQLMIYPGIMISVTVLGFNLLGDGLRDVLDPRYTN